MKCQNSKQFSLTHEYNMYIGISLDPNSRRTHRKTSKWKDNRSKKCHYHIVQLVLDYSSTIPVVLASNERNLIPNNFLSIVNVTMDFSIAIT